MDNAGTDIAIVGLSCRLPGANNAEEFWNNLIDGKTSFSSIEEDDLTAANIDPECSRTPSYIRKSPTLGNIDAFDARFFGMSDEEVVLTDPQLRLMLEVGYEALEDAGAVEPAKKWVSGVYASVGGITTSYLYNVLNKNTGLYGGTGSLIHTCNDKDFFATKLAYKFDLKGPALTVQTACSSSLVAVHLARSALILQEVDIALVAASCIRIPHRVGYDASLDPILSKDGVCRPFDDAASGTVFGSGTAAVVLMRLTDAIAGKHPIYGVIKSTAVNNDGGQKVGYTASSVPGQVGAIKKALAKASIDAADISYVECHGTATKLGDPLEIKALQQALGAAMTRVRQCGIGSVKANIGHLEQAAGLASLIKLALMLKNKVKVATPHFRHPNKKINFSELPFYVVNRTEDWTAEGSKKLVAGLNCLGMGGTNAFAIIEEPPCREQPRAISRYDILCISAKTGSELKAYARLIADFIERHPEQASAVCKSFNIGRGAFRYRYSLPILGDKGVLPALYHCIERDALVQPFSNVKSAYYVSNMTGDIIGGALERLFTDPKLHVFRDCYVSVEKSLKLHLAAAEINHQRITPLINVLSFEVAFIRQLGHWSMNLQVLPGIGNGTLISQIIEQNDYRSAAQAILELAYEPRASLMRVYGARHVDLPSWCTVVVNVGPFIDIRIHEHDMQTWRDFACAQGYSWEALAWPLGYHFAMASTVTPSLSIGPKDHYSSLHPLPTKVGRAFFKRQAAQEDVDYVRCFYEYLCGLLEDGFEINWQRYYERDDVTMCSLPHYPFTRSRYWFN